VGNSMKGFKGKGRIVPERNPSPELMADPRQFRDTVANRPGVRPKLEALDSHHTVSLSKPGVARSGMIFLGWKMER
jgi:hypothetical protein